MPTILAIESSCDDTSAAVVRDGRVLSNVTAAQEIHVEYGGVVPEFASRAHQRNIVPTVEVALRRASVSADQVDAVAFTRGPGLIGSLMVGVSFAKAFALARNIPLIEVDHMQAHVLAHFAEDPKPEFPFLCMTVSGGHTQLVVVRSPLEQEIIGRTIDDAAGEAFDKSGKLLGLPYPAGPELDRLAGLGTPTLSFAQPDPGALDFSFSGLKTSILYTLQKKVKEDPDYVRNHLNDICAAVQDAIVTTLMNKLIAAAEQTGLHQVALAGGVSANGELRRRLAEEGRARGWQTFVPRPEYCTDNAAMIGVTATFKYELGYFADQSVAPAARF
ncbi:tRNA (adenosine(37)-N6)-threonylcarbamoyltransferase complex transferase subunit TsaD [Lewinella sp. JB7]|uniref:tRNA (adenosine(37)-N6)-threonylcarbamoyltransferase complex transferase subunit TsaD n=1 Tax=Lewinella sp. JB7 TaxID=2962887 RepID=UPI0020C99183|nr:tRNA (adenosine(37)-N6)-threonylcarbamoyltransferase complex transferase subunit TsaD [Lewinella sp. JB7]MCP9234928.1 tRNA (adenosine(37)-N6)-threonylcarbamoyltransferase complex transferase subunit TsaD [Lewinella sp. JB7]